MIIVNADDWGRSQQETDVALRCHRAAEITSVTAMVFMSDSQRAAQLARADSIPVGLHLNLTEAFSGDQVPSDIRERHGRVARFLTRGKFATLLYNPALRNDFRYLYEAQLEEFGRLYGVPPTHIDGHQHQHLCANMLVDGVIPRGQKVRRTFYFWPGEKGALNRAVRYAVNKLLKTRYRGTDYFFALGQCLDQSRMARVAALARESVVEMMTHPVSQRERSYLSSEDFRSILDGVERGSYGSL